MPPADLFEGGRDVYRQAASRPPHHPQEGACMGSSPTLAHPDRTWDTEDVIAHPPVQHRTAGVQPTTRDLEQAFDRLNPDYGVPADTHDPSGHQDLRDRETARSLRTRVAVASSRYD